MNNELINKGRYRLALKVHKNDRSKPIFGLEKVPAEALLKLALEEIGEQESYIEELKQKIRKMEKSSVTSLKDERKALVHEVKSEAFLLAKRNQYYANLENKLIRQGKLVRSLFVTRDELIRKVLRLQEEIDQLSRHNTED
jgi:hypothetical protein